MNVCKLKTCKEYRTNIDITETKSSNQNGRSRNIKIRAQLKILTERDIDKNLFTDVSSLDARHLQSRNEY